MRGSVAFMMLVAAMVPRAAAAQAVGTIVPGQTLRGTLATGDETLQSGEFADTWRLQGRRGQRLSIRLAATAFDPYLLVRGPGGLSADNDDDATERGSRNARIDLTLEADGEIRVVATSYRPGESGAYTLVVTESGGAAPAPAPAPATPASAVGLGRTVSGRLESGDATLRSGEFLDTYTLDGRRGQQLDIRLVSREFDPYLMLRGPSGFTQDNDDDVGSGTSNSRLTLTLPADGAYRVVATSYRPGESGAYQLTIAETGTPVAPGGGGVAARVLAMGQAVQGRLEAGDDTLQDGEFADRYTFRGTRGARIAIDLRGTGLDPYLTLITPTGRQEENDDFREGVLDSRLETVLLEDGDYTVIATTYARRETGAYQLVVAPLGARSATPAVAGAVAPGGTPMVLGSPVAGRLQAGDATLPSGEFVDRYTFTGQRGSVVSVEMQSTALDPYVMIRAPDGTQQENDDAAAGDRNARLIWSLPMDGVYSVLATSYRPGESGGYTVRVGPAGTAAPPPVAGRPAPGPSAGARRVYALLVGISDYGGRANNLPYTAEDAVKLAQTLRRAGVLAEESVVLTDADATYDRVRTAFQNLARAAGPEDVFLFFYSGHGGQRDNPSSNEPDRRDETIVFRDRAVTDDEMGQWFQAVHARMGIIALDACFSGGFARDVVNRPGVMGLFSSEEDLTSAVAGKFQAGGYLSHFLRTGLAGEADLEPRNGLITAGELSTYLRRQFATGAVDVEAISSDRERNYQYLVIDRGGVKIDDVVLRIGD